MNKPKQERSRRTLARLIAGAIREFETKPPRDVTIKDVVARSRSSVGSFYARFEGKRDLVEALDDRLWGHVADRWHEVRVGLLEADDPSFERALIEPLADVFSTDASARRAIVLELTWEGGESKQEAVLGRLRGEIGEILRSWSADGSGSPVGPDLCDFLADLLVRCLHGGGTSPTEVHYLAWVIRSALRPERGEPRADAVGPTPAVDPFDIWA